MTAQQTTIPGTPKPTPLTPATTPMDPTGQPAKRRNRSPRGRVLGGGEGDYCIYEIAPADMAACPKGALLPIPGVPRFVDTQSALKWIRQESKDLLIGKQVMVLRACEILSLALQTAPRVVVATKPKIAVAKPETANG